MIKITTITGYLTRQDSGKKAVVKRQAQEESYLIRRETKAITIPVLNTDKVLRQSCTS